MNVVVTKSYDESCAYVADMICKLVNEKPDCKLGLATGGTPVPMYKKLIEANKAGKVDFSKVRTVNLDEYCGIPETHDQSYRYFMNTNLFDHINIDKANTYVAQGMGDPEANAAALEAKVREGPTNIERNLYLTTQLTETGVPVVIALNMADLIRKRGMKIDKKRLSCLLYTSVQNEM